MLDRLRPHWPAVAFAISAALLAGAHAFQSFGHMAPCPMCLAQREWHWGILGVAFVSFLVLRRRPGDARWIALVLALAFLGSFAMAADHVAVEHHWITAQCETGPVGNL
ncbi:MAG TPA: disulfide bond formation protein B, partial [Rhizomicrobium sp.]